MANIQDHHLRSLTEESGIRPDVVESRGYETVTTMARLKKLGFASNQLIVPTLLIPIRGVDGNIVSYQSRPDQPRVGANGKAVKYEMPAKSRMVLDVHPSTHHLLRDPSVPLWITEGVKKGDSLATQGACAVALMGVWNFRGTNELGGKLALPEWESIALNGRRTFVVFDSDVMLKASVYNALTRLVAFLRSRGAECYVIYLAALTSGAKQGVDDFLAAGHGMDDLLQLATDQIREPPAKGAPEEGEDDDNASQATLMVALTAEMELFHDDKGDAFICLEIDGHVETWSTRSGSFKRWLARALYLTHGKAPRSASIADAITTIEGKAVFECEELSVPLRVGEHGDSIFHLDLGNKSWQSVRVSGEGWSLVDSSPVRFRRGQTMAALPAPQRGGSLDELKRLLNIEPDDDFMLIVAWLLGCLRPHGPYPVLAFIAEQGSGKTSAARMLRSLVDPSSVALGGMIREERDLMIAARANHVVAVDNVSSLPQWFSDALCRLATGGGWMTRRLYTDAEQEVFTQTRPVLLTGIEEFLNSGDLLDRTILINLPAIPPEKRRQEADLEREFQDAWPRILGCLLDAASCALRTVRTVNPPVLPRMADFATWVIAAEPALGWKPGNFLRTYLARANAANEIILEASMLSEPIRLLVGQGPWTGTASQLLEHLKATVPEELTRSTPFPKTAKAVGNHLRRVAPNLRSVGVDITFDRESQAGRRRMIYIRRLNSENTVQNVQSGDADSDDPDPLDGVDGDFPVMDDGQIALSMCASCSALVPVGNLHCLTCAARMHPLVAFAVGQGATFVSSVPTPAEALIDE